MRKHRLRLSLLLLPAAAAEEAVRGVAAAEWAAYRSGGALFRCRDGQAELPLAKLNDEYCDCADSSDEPGTSACALGRFHCANVGFRPMALPSSRVDDGICDCCDGSDEAGAAGNPGCVTDCDAVGVEHRKAAAERAATFERGLATARGYAAKGLAARQGWDAEIEAKRAVLEAAKAKAEGVRAEKTAAEAVEREMQEAERRKREAEAEAFTAAEAVAAAGRVAELEALGALRTRCEAERSVDEAAMAECAEAAAAEVAQSAAAEALEDQSGEACVGWAEKSECENNAHFMASHCAATCSRLQASAEAAEAGAAAEEEAAAAASAAAVEGAPVDARPVCAGRVGGEGGIEFASRCHALAAGFRGECEALVAAGPCDPPRLATLAEDCDCAAGLSKGGGGLACHCAPCASVAPCLAPQCEVCGPPSDGCDATRGQWGCYGVAGEAPAGSAAVEAAEAAAARTTGAGLKSLKAAAAAAEPSAEEEEEEEEAPDPDERPDPDPYGEHYTAGEDAYDEDMYREEGGGEWAEHDDDAELPEEADDTVGEEDDTAGEDEGASSRYRGGYDDDEESGLEEDSESGVRRQRGSSSSAAKAASSSTSDLPKDAGGEAGWLGWLAGQARRLFGGFGGPVSKWVGGGEQDAAPAAIKLPEAERLRAELKRAEATECEAQRALDEATALTLVDFGPDLRWFALKGECFKWAPPGSEFSYELCPFGEATQSGGTTLGKWEGFEAAEESLGNYSRMKFGGGAHCWATGSGRTAVASIQCAEANVVFSVDEPEVCRYAFVVGTPAACTPELVNRARADAGMPPVAVDPPAGGAGEEAEHDEL